MIGKNPGPKFAQGMTNCSANLVRTCYLMISHWDRVVKIFLQGRFDGRFWSAHLSMSERRFRPAHATPLDLSLGIP